MIRTKHSAASLAIVVFALTTNVDAQFFTHVKILAGTSAANQSWQLSSNPEWQTDDRWSIAGSVSVEAVELPFASLILGIQYAQKGMAQRIPLTTESDPENLSGRYFTISPRIDYLSFPLLVQVRVPLSTFTPYLLAGGRADVMIAKRGNGYDAVIDKFRNSEIGLTGGIGAELPIHPLFDVIVEFRYDASLQYSYSTEFLKVRNRAFVILAGVRL